MQGWGHPGLGLRPGCLSLPVALPHSLLSGPGWLPPGPLTVPEALGADACVAVDRIHALGPVTAPVGHAVIDVHLAELPTVARETFAPGTQQSETVPWACPASRRPLLLPLSPRGS